MPGPPKGKYKVPKEEMSQKSIASLKPGNFGMRPGSGRETAEIRDILRAATKQSAPLIAKIATGKSPYEEMEYTPTADEILKAFDRCAKFSLPELEPVLEEKFIYVLAEVLAEDQRIPFECISDITARMVEKLSPNAETRADARDGDVSGSGD